MVEKPGEGVWKLARENRHKASKAGGTSLQLEIRHL